MKVVESPMGLKIIEKTIPKEILELKPVIAGGFVASIYYAILKYADVPKLQKELEIKVNRAVNNWAGAEDLSSLLGLKFGDIDFWFLNDNAIWKKEHPSNFLLSDFQDDNSSKRVLQAQKAHTVAVAGSPFLSLKEVKRSFYDEEKKYREFIKLYGLSGRISNSSYWANSYNMKSSIDCQFIKKKYQNIEELFSKFDILNCCAAFYDGKFYFQEGFEEAFDECLLMAGKSLKRPSVLSQIWSASRYFKYANRFNLEFSREICEHLVDVFMDANLLLLKIRDSSFDKSKGTINLGEVKEIDDPYGRNGEVSIHKLEGMIETLLRYFPNLTKMKNFDQDKVFLFLNTKDTGLKVYLEKYLDNVKQEPVSKLSKEPEGLWE